MVSWLHWFWACGEVEYYGGEHMVEQSCQPHGSWEAKKKPEKGWSPWPLQGHIPCRERLLDQLGTETVLRRLLFQRTGFYSNTFTRHFPMDPNACLCYPSQPGVTQTFPQISLTNEGGRSCAPGDPHSGLWCRSSSRFTGDTQWSSGEGALSQAVAASTSGSQGKLWQHGLWCQGGEQGFGFWPEFIYPVVTSPLLLSTLSP
jgi:hypothetical protein